MAEDKRIAVIMPPALHQQLVDLAQRDKRSLNAYLNVLLEKHVAEAKANG